MSSALPPTQEFCCGCSLRSGVSIIMGFHLLACTVYVATAFCNLVLHMQSFGSSWSPLTQIVLTALYLSGLPIILLALYGVAKGTLVNVQLYLGYLSLCFLIDNILLIHAFGWQDPCETSGSFIKLLGQDFGTAFVCGFTRIFSWGFTIVIVAIEVYCLYVVWSLCEQIRLGSSWLSELIPGMEAFNKKHDAHYSVLKDDSCADIVGLAHHKAQGPYPSPYGATDKFAAPNYKLLGGTTHDTNYPP